MRCHAVLLRWVAMLCASAALVVSGCGGGADSTATTPPAPDDGTPQQGLGAIGSITLNVPRQDVPTSGNANGRIVLEWSSSGDAAIFTAWLSPGEGKPFVEVAANLAGNSATFHPGPSWKLDFPTAQVRVRGCDSSGESCTDSNAQPLAAVLVEARPSLIPTVDPTTSTVGGTSSYVIDDSASTIAALRATDVGMFGDPAENFSPARVDLYQRFATAWTSPFGIPTPDFRGPTTAMALSGDGHTLAIPLHYSFGGSNGPMGISGVVVVYDHELNESGGRYWRCRR